jgi:hypothetical protein
MADIVQRLREGQLSKPITETEIMDKCDRCGQPIADGDRVTFDAEGFVHSDCAIGTPEINCNAEQD